MEWRFLFHGRPPFSYDGFFSSSRRLAMPIAAFSPICVGHDTTFGIASSARQRRVRTCSRLCISFGSPHPRAGRQTCTSSRFCGVRATTLGIAMPTRQQKVNVSRLSSHARTSMMTARAKSLSGSQPFGFTPSRFFCELQLASLLFRS